MVHLTSKLMINGTILILIESISRFWVAMSPSNLNDFNCRNQALTANFLRQGYRYFLLREAFRNFIADAEPS